MLAVARIDARGGTVADLDEVRLVRSAQGGDVGAFETLYRKFVPRVYGLCLRMVADPTTAEELTQEAFVRVWEKLDMFRGNRPFAPWLLTVATNVVLSDRRKYRRKDGREAGTEPDVLARVPEVRPSHRGGTGVDLERAIASLPEGARRVFVLHDIEGYRHDEIAGMMGIATGTTKAQLHRARRMLREVLAT